MNTNRVGLHALTGTAMFIISLIAASNLWLFLGWVLGVAFVLWSEDSRDDKIVVKKEPDNNMFILNRNTWYDD